jgi:hypothetical protein
MTARRKLWVSFGIAFGVPALIAMALAIVWGEQLVLFGYKSHRLIGTLNNFEEYLASAEHESELATHYTVCVFGDSSHFYKLPAQSRMLPTLRRELTARKIDDVAVYGMSFTALTAWDYYLLLNRVAPDAPDLLILPVQLGSFSTAWLTRRPWHFPTLHRYLPVSEFGNVYGLSVAGRSFRWEQIALQRLDYAVFGGKAKPFFGGIRYLWNLGRAGAEQAVGEALMGDWPPISDALDQPPTWQKIDDDIREDHELFSSFDLINRLAAERDIPILYYTAQINEKAYARLGIELRLNENYDRITRRLKTGPGIHVLELGKENPEEVFADESLHYNPFGISRLAARLIEAVVEIRAGRDPDRT